jgi:hypothetical protein
MAGPASLIGTYVRSKADWYTVTEPGQSVNNFGRWQLTEPSYASSYSRSFNFQLISPSTFTPPDDQSQRIAAHNLGVAGGRAVTGGYDFLWRGNYLSPDYIVYGIGDGVNTFNVNNGYLYYAGDATSFDSGSPPGPIVRNWAEVISTDNLDSTIPLVDGNTYIINLTSTMTSNCTFCNPTFSVYSLTLTSTGSPSFCCSDFNGTFNLVNVNTCQWNSVQTTTCAAGGSVWVLTIDDSFASLQSGNGIAIAYSTNTWNCSTSNVLSLEIAECTVPSTVTITPVG